nr:MAG TPA: hypothetical protein [Caudoviricetes sp.]
MKFKEQVLRGEIPVNRMVSLEIGTFEQSISGRVYEV